MASGIGRTVSCPAIIQIQIGVVSSQPVPECDGLESISIYTKYTTTNFREAIYVAFGNLRRHLLAVAALGIRENRGQGKQMTRTVPTLCHTVRIFKPEIK
jgi:hypothetical protein